MPSSVEQRFVYGDGRRPQSPQRSAVSPLAYFSSVTLAEHEEVQRQLDLVRSAAIQKQADLDAVTRTHRKQQQGQCALLDREEAALRAELRSIEQVMQQVAVATERHLDAARADGEEHAAEVAALREELDTVAALEEDIRRLRDSLTGRCADASAHRATFISENDRSVAELKRARDEAARMGVEVNRVRAVSPLRGTRMGASSVSFATPRPPQASRISPPRSPRSPPRSPGQHGESRFVSPTRRGRDTVQASVARSRAERVGSPPRSVNASYASDGGGGGGGAGLSSSGAGAGEAPLMHRLCATGQVEEAIAMLRQRPEVVHSLDPDANTPLHAACGSPHISLELINALLLEGASTSAKNDDGFTAFHVACLNTADDNGHSLKKYLLFKATVPPNQRTSRGETAAHLCARQDKHIEALKYLTSTGVDLTITALGTGDSGEVGSPRRRSALEVAQQAGVRARRCADVLKLASDAN